MRRFKFTRWSGRVDEVEATHVHFVGQWAIFWKGKSLVLAVQGNDCNNVRELPVFEDIDNADSNRSD